MTAPIAITMGDASGVGPEIVLRRWAAGLLPNDTVVYGDLEILRRGASLLGLDAGLEVRGVDPADRLPLGQ